MDKNVLFIKRIFIITFVFCFIFCFVGCSKNNVESERLYFDFLGTTVYVNIQDTGPFFWDKQKTEKCFNEIDSALKSISSEFSKENQTSVIAKFNSLQLGESVEVSQSFQTVFGLAKEYYQATDGAFNPLVSLLVDLWGFSKRHLEVEFVAKKPYDRERNADGSFNLPNSAYVRAFTSLCDFSKIEIVEGNITQNLSTTVGGETYLSQLDLSGIVKGYASEKITEIISSYGFCHFYTSIGTSSMYLSSNLDGSAFNLGITNPNDPLGKPIKDIVVKDRYVSTSGVYQNCYSLDGKNYHHIIDAKIGAPSETDILSATIIANSGERADALSTAVMVMGSQKALEFFESSADIGYVLICKDKIYERV